MDSCRGFWDIAQGRHFLVRSHGSYVLVQGKQAKASKPCLVLSTMRK